MAGSRKCEKCSKWLPNGVGTHKVQDVGKVCTGRSELTESICLNSSSSASIARLSDRRYCIFDEHYEWDGNFFMIRSFPDKGVHGSVLLAFYKVISDSGICGPAAATSFWPFREFSFSSCISPVSRVEQEGTSDVNEVLPRDSLYTTAEARLCDFLDYQGRSPPELGARIKEIPSQWHPGHCCCRSATY